MQEVSSSKLGFDLFLFKLINNVAKKSRVLDFFAVFFARHIPYLMVIFLLLFAIAMENFQLFLFPIFSGLFARFVVNEMFYFLYPRKRPAEIVAVNQLIENPNHPSFPSGHTSAFFAMSFTLMSQNLSLGIYFLVLSSLMGLSRVFVGVHWPFDVLAGIISGFLSFLLLLLVTLF